MLRGLNLFEMESIASFGTTPSSWPIVKVGRDVLYTRKETYNSPKPDGIDICSDSSKGSTGRASKIARMPSAEIS
jgi:hypothetical protein